MCNINDPDVSLDQQRYVLAAPENKDRKSIHDYCTT